MMLNSPVQSLPSRGYMLEQLPPPIAILSTTAATMTTSPPHATDLESISLEPADFLSTHPLKKVPHGDVFEAARAGDVERLSYLLESGVNVNARDRWDSVALYYACLAGHLDAARMLLESGAICEEHTFEGDRCHYAALNLKVRKLLKAFEARPPPLGALQGDLREVFFGCEGNQGGDGVGDGGLGFLGQVGSSSNHFPSDIIFYAQGRPIEAHRVILSARSAFFKMKFETEWKDRAEVRFSKEKLSYPALYSLIHFFYADRLEIAVDDMEDLVRICKVCKCESLRKVLEKELNHQRFADYKALREIESSQRRFILQSSSLPEEDRLPAALHRIFQICLQNSCVEQDMDNRYVEDLADICVKVDGTVFRCHQVVLASRSDYFKTRIFRIKDFLNGTDDSSCLPCIEENDLSKEAFEKMIEYMYTDALRDIDPEQVEEMFDAASRYFLLPLKRAVADALLPHLEMASPAEVCHWLLLADMYDVVKIREYCLDMLACNFKAFSDTREFRAMLLTLPPPSGDSSLRTTAPSAPGTEGGSNQANLLDDLREKWLEIEAADLDERDESAFEFDRQLKELIFMAEQEQLDESQDSTTDQ
ncbi:hypothetical protein Droror1_Dr00022902 [Drosera rotundifolia]